MSKTEQPKLKVLDLFSGIGGFSLGLERAGMETVAFCEIDKHCRKVLRQHWPDALMIDDIKKAKGSPSNLVLTNGSTTIHEHIDVICGGFPCQDISVAGQKKGFEDEKEILSKFEQEFIELHAHAPTIGKFKEGLRELCKRIGKAGAKTKGRTTRSGLWQEYLRLIKEIEPRYAIIENVANLRSLGLNQVLQDLWKIGYASEWHIISARSIGACHLRERVWIIAYPRCGFGGASDKGNKEELRRGQTDGKEVGPQDAPTLERPSTGRQTVAGELENAGFAYSDSSRFGKQLWPISEEKKLSSSELCSTGYCDGNFTNPDLPRLWKPLASEEASQRWWAETTSSFRDWWKVESTICRVDNGLSSRLDKDRRERVKQLGNAVVPQIPELIGRAILKYEGEKNEQSN